MGATPHFYINIAVCELTKQLNFYMWPFGSMAECSTSDRKVVGSNPMRVYNINILHF
jgi:hypothetical protein